MKIALARRESPVAHSVQAWTVRIPWSEDLFLLQVQVEEQRERGNFGNKFYLTNSARFLLFIWRGAKMIEVLSSGAIEIFRGEVLEDVLGLENVLEDTF